MLLNCIHKIEIKQSLSSITLISVQEVGSPNICKFDFYWEMAIIFIAKVAIISLSLMLYVITWHYYCLTYRSRNNGISPLWGMQTNCRPIKMSLRLVCPAALSELLPFTWHLTGWDWEYNGPFETSVDIEKSIYDLLKTKITT